MRPLILLSLLLAALPLARVIDADRRDVAAGRGVSARAEDEPFAIKKIPEQRYVGVRDTLKRAMVIPRVQKLIAELEHYLEVTGGEASGPPFTRYVTLGGTTVQIEVCLPVAERVEESDRFRNGTLPSSRVACAKHEGAYEGLPEIYRKLGNWMTEKGLEPHGGPWEVYLNEPSEVSDPGELRTEIYWPLK